MNQNRRRVGIAIGVGGALEICGDEADPHPVIYFHVSNTMRRLLLTRCEPGHVPVARSAQTEARARGAVEMACAGVAHAAAPRDASANAPPARLLSASRRPVLEADSDIRAAFEGRVDYVFRGGSRNALGQDDAVGGHPDASAATCFPPNKVGLILNADGADWPDRAVTADDAKNDRSNFFFSDFGFLVYAVPHRPTEIRPIRVQNRSNSNGGNGRCSERRRPSFRTDATTGWARRPSTARTARPPTA